MANKLSNGKIRKLVNKLATHHPKANVQLTYSICGIDFWSVSVICVGGLNYGLPSFALNAEAELRHIARNGIDFTKKGSQI